jgi:hypothetical protein
LVCGSWDDDAAICSPQSVARKSPIWLQAPRVAHQKYLLLPTFGLLVGIFAVMKLSPRPRPWSGWLVVGVLLGLMGRYVLWRSLSTLNLSNPLNGVFSLWLFFLEMLVLFSNTIQLAYNLLLLGISLLILLDVPKQDVYEWFDLQRVVRVDVANQSFWGITTAISEIGASIKLTQAIPLPLEKLETLSVKLEIMEEKLQLSGVVTQTRQEEFILYSTGSL